MTPVDKNRTAQRNSSSAESAAASPAQRRKRTEGWLLLLIAALLTLIIVPKGGLIPAYHAPGEIATRDIKSPRDLLVEDPTLTAAKRQEAATAVPMIYELDRSAGQKALSRLRQGLELILQYQQADAGPLPADFQQQLEGVLGIPLAENEQWSLLSLPLDHDLAVLTGELLKPIFTRPIVADIQAFEKDWVAGAQVVTAAEGEPVGQALLDQTIGLNQTLSEAKKQLELIPGITQEQLQALLALVQQQLRPNLVPDQQRLVKKQQQAREQVTPVLFQVKKGEMIVREGERVTAEQILKLQAIRESGRGNHGLRTAAGLFLTTLLLIYAGYTFARANIKKFKPDVRDLTFLASVLLSLFLLLKLSIVIATGMGNSFSYFAPSVYYYAFPFALGAMLVRIVLNSETALLFALACALLVGTLFSNSLPLAIYALVGSLVGAHGVRHCQQRTTLYRAGLWLGLVNMAMVVAFHLLSGRSFDLELLWKIGFAFAGGLLSAVFVNGTVPLIELVFKYTTDIKLLELANMNAPVLRRLMIEAPGTYHHSILVGNLAESAAESINANPLLVRVAAYYHDIGKLKKPLYFIENTGGQRNRHDKLAPSMSALILTSHVKDGVELARENKLGVELIDIIRQHHGTALIKFFYERAKNQVVPGVQQVDEQNFRYPGPKPQTREAALIMLADAVEAASRTLTDPTQARIQGMVKKLITNIFRDGQLNECDLTLKDLHQIAKCFNRVLVGSFHYRIDYPEPVHIVRQKKDPVAESLTNERAQPDHADSDRQPPETNQDPEAAVAEDRAEDLRRLGIS